MYTPKYLQIDGVQELYTSVCQVTNPKCLSRFVCHLKYPRIDELHVYYVYFCNYIIYQIIIQKFNSVRPDEVGTYIVCIVCQVTRR